ncbi:cardiolipin synthase [Aliidiomarina sp. Khilg15.8]
MASFDIFFVLYWLIVAATTLRVIFTRKTISAAMAWLLIIYVVPLLGAVLYFLFGELRLGRRRGEKAASMREPYLADLRQLASEHPQDDDKRPMPSLQTAVHNVLTQQLGVGSLNYDNFTVLSTSSEVFTQLLSDIEAATTSIRMEFYIWHSQGRVHEIEKALIAACERGVKVELLIDDAGAWRFFFSKGYKSMKNAGIRIVAALPVSPIRLPFRRADIRMHRKVIVIDHDLAYTGSMNMADPLYFNKHVRVGQWIDAMVRFRGPAAIGLSRLFSWDWEVETNERKLDAMKFEATQGSEAMAIIPSGPGLNTDLISQVMLCAIYRADHSITICTPYFVPTEPIFEALCQAADRGVNICIIVPKRNDSWLVSWSSRAFYDALLQAGAEIRLFEGGLLHTKAMIVDEEMALFGSVNLDVRSLQVNFELSLALFHSHGCRAICELISTYHGSSEAIDPERWHKRSVFKRLRERLVFFLSPLL